MLYDYLAGDTPLLINVPHAGTELPDGLAPRLSAVAAALPDTDWHVHRLVAFAAERGASILSARLSRYAIDLNRSRDDRPLYAGATTGLVPRETFSGQPVYATEVPDEDEVAQRISDYWQPYHDHLGRCLEALQQRHGYALLLDAHSIRGFIPRLFEGRLPDLNLGTWEGRSCDSALRQEVAHLLEATEGFTHVVDGRFKGGYNTRHYGQPGENIHALQLEIAQHCYMDEKQPEIWDAERAGPLMRVLEGLVDLLLQWRPE